MPNRKHKIKLPEEQVTQGVALVVLLIFAGLGIAGPSGLLAWNENSNLLEQRTTRIAELSVQRDALKNRVDLLDYNYADPDLTSELLRKNLNVAHPDEVVLLLPEPEPAPEASD